jgi:hypothetical protein
MARAHSIWIVRNLHNRLVGAWTVKYELKTWAERIGLDLDEVGNAVTQLEVFRLRDGKPGCVTNVPWSEIL